MVLEDRRLVAVFAHHPELLVLDDGFDSDPTRVEMSATYAIRLHLLGLSTADHGRRFDYGQKLSDLVMEALIADALDGRSDMILTGVVAKDNLASIRLCERHGLCSQVEYSPDYIRISGRFARL